MKPDLAFAKALDKEDALSHYKHEFYTSDTHLIYLDGNSLGRLPKASLLRAEELVKQEWGSRLIRGWNEGWFEAPERIGAKIAALIGAQKDEVIVADSTTINLFKLLLSALHYQKDRNLILTDDLNFPSDLYAMEAACKLLDKGHSVKRCISADGIHGPVEDLLGSLDRQVSLLSLTHTVFKSGFVYDMNELTQAAHEVGALALWDLSHSVGSVDIDLNGANVDLAVGCTYKYLNGGPGAPAFLYVRKDLQAKLFNPLAGWMGKKNMFDFALEYEADSSIRQFLTGTPPILSLELMEPGVDMLLDVGMKALRQKSVQQSEYFIYLWEEKLASYGFSLKSPRDVSQRGSHVSLGHKQGLSISQAMIHEKNIIPDFRPPDNLRFGLTPLYLSFKDIFNVVSRIEEIMQEKLYEKYLDSAPVVT